MLVVRRRQIALPARVVRIGLGQPFARWQARRGSSSARRADRPGQAARRRSCCATPTDRAASPRCPDRPWPAVHDGMRGAVARQRGGQIALGNLHVADVFVRHRQIALPARVARIGLGQPFSDGKRGAVARQRGGQIALGNSARRRSCRATPRDRAATRRCPDRPWPAVRGW